jgi:hypothetical protein
MLTKESKQNAVERQLLEQLGDRYKHAKLLEVSDGSYLITLDIRLPIFGKQVQLKPRDKQSISNRGYLLTEQSGKYTSQRQRAAPTKLNDPLSTLPK